MRLYVKFLFFVFLYSISYDKWFPVKSADLSASSSPGSGAGTNEGQQASGTPTSGGTTTGAGAGSGTKTGVELSLKATAETNEFNYKKDNKIVTYTAKDTYGFKSVKTGDTVVWSTTNVSEYASKVVLNGKGNKKKEVTIHLPNNTKKVFKRESKGKPWIEGSHLAKDPSKTASKPRKNVTQEDVNWALKKCTQVKYEKKEVWTYKDGEYPERIRYLESDKKIHIHFHF
ncbi:conserved hypothetical protein [Theileria orientalis strain Shintoku]|uniref:Uncharacterized protein n=1 Tax=Theileria orientalis strain Shintoku TaxID=869250 RepID=J4C8X9_THEOR|nr:conserved hypothetical protein [Theileria orientalis strain Shintoku]BAM41568.1 conserved hypothetical protein [Theileria orientalis strain Shintoku]|eukprot:XP_009691869.1 conserved hypothetical protein [Theileria orientalis strain Shintoku]